MKEGNYRKREKRTSILGLNPNVFFLSLVSLFNDISSEMIFNVLPLFLSNVLGAKTTIIGLIEGIGESTGIFARIPSGLLSDRLRKYKAVTTVGYTISALSKPFLYLANTWGLVLGVRIADRLGKGIRTSPRDALIANSTPAGEMGKSFGFHRTMDTLGAVLGIVIAAAVVFYLQKGALTLGRSTFQSLVLVGIVPGFIAVILLFSAVREAGTPQSRDKDQASSHEKAILPQGAKDLKEKDRAFKVFLVVITLFSLGNFSNAFLVLRAQNLGFSVVHILLLMVGFNVIYSLSSFPAGLLSDRLGRKALIFGGWLFSGFVYLGFALATAPWQLLPLFALYGAYYGATEGVARAFVADVVQPQTRGTAYGIYHAAIGISTFFSSLIAGWLWQVFSPPATFIFGGAMSVSAAVLLALFVREPRAITS